VFSAGALEAIEEAGVLIEDMQVRNLAPLTQRAYVEHVSRFAHSLLYFETVH
jgi:hypothetical protein